jgi:hypothetical protein
MLSGVIVGREQDVAQMMIKLLSDGVLNQGESQPQWKTAEEVWGEGSGRKFYATRDVQYVYSCATRGVRITAVAFLVLNN